MLNMGFAEDMDAILSETRKTGRRCSFPPRCPPASRKSPKRHLRKPTRVKVAKELPASGEEAKVRQTAYIVTRDVKAKALGRILEIERPASPSSSAAPDPTPTVSSISCGIAVSNRWPSTAG